MDFRGPSHNFDVFLSMLSVFDVGGVLYDRNNMSISQGLECDTAKLLQDRNTLDKDYRKACERLSEELAASLNEKR